MRSICDHITALVPTSPVPSHPSTAIIEETIGAIRHYLPDSRLEIMVDGVRPSIEHRREQYQEYKTNLWRLRGEGKFGNCGIRDFEVPSQQAIMTRETLKNVKTPLILFVEHDAILRADPPIRVDVIVNVLMADAANVCRFYAWGDVWHEHQYLMRGEVMYYGVKFTKTVQYSQWPLFSTTEYHRMILSKFFKPDERSMIETTMYGPVANSKIWDVHRILIYGPDGSPTISHRNARFDEKTGIVDPADW